MPNTIDVTENGSNRKLSIVVTNILYVETLTYNSGTTVTVITLVGNKEIHVDEKTDYVKDLIKNAD